MLAGNRDPQEIIASVKNGIYAVSFGGGQVDITSGKYVFQCTEAYRIDSGKIGAPVKGAMLIGTGPTDLHRVTMIGNDFALDPGVGTCGKNGQGVPVGVGQPTLRMFGNFLYPLRQVVCSFEGRTGRCLNNGVNHAVSRRQACVPAQQPEERSIQRRTVDSQGPWRT